MYSHMENAIQHDKNTRLFGLELRFAYYNFLASVSCLSTLVAVFVTSTQNSIQVVFEFCWEPQKTQKISLTFVLNMAEEQLKKKPLPDRDVHYIDLC